MTPKDLTADLPPPRDDEPASLRRDIVDELTDHLACALHRELLRGASSGPCETASDSPDSSFRTDPHPDSSLRAAQNTVVARFGNPAAVAHRLWLDAMKEKLMAQKITILLASVATAAVVVLSGLMWLSLERSQEAQAALLQQHQQFSAGILQALESLRSAPPASTGVDGWTPLTVKLVSESGDPVQGDVRVFGKMLGSSKGEEEFDVNLARSSGPNGIADCGMVPYGNYEMRVTVPAAQETHTELIMVAPGQPTERTVVCPTSPPPTVSIRFKFDPPEGLDRDKLLYNVVMTEFRKIGSEKWERADHADSLIFAVDADGNVVGSLTRSVTIDQGRNDDGSLSQTIVNGVDDSLLPEFRAYQYRIEGVTVFVRVDGVEGLPSDFPDVAVVAGSEGVNATEDTAEFQPQAGENVWPVDLPGVTWQWVVYWMRLSPLVRHAALPDGMQIIDAVVTARSLMNLPLYRDRITNVQRAAHRDRTSELPPNERVDILVNVKETESDTGRNRMTEQTLVRSAELISTPDPRTQFGRSGFGRSRSSDSTVPVSFLVTDAQVEAIRIAERKGVLSVGPAEEKSSMPKLDQAVFEQLQEIPDKEP